MDSLFLLVLLPVWMAVAYLRLNPYFNGFTILTFYEHGDYKCQFMVSILILMDSLFLQNEMNRFERMEKSLNPYFNGFTILTEITDWTYKKSMEGLNPYFNGFTILTRTFEKTLYLSMLQEFFQTLKSYFFD